ncbi:hypothetical protein TWF225_003278 [Orbilia oligospora]|nr:hypothetical protein TWF225_003278 [Orbilia oligospora]KAF3267322.1 hypothetical protein TWF217_000393 [Orbilia oligospora]
MPICDIVPILECLPESSRLGVISAGLCRNFHFTLAERRLHGRLFRKFELTNGSYYITRWQSWLTASAKEIAIANKLKVWARN